MPPSSICSPADSMFFGFNGRNGIKLEALTLLLQLIEYGFAPVDVPVPPEEFRYP